MSNVSLDVYYAMISHIVCLEKEKRNFSIAIVCWKFSSGIYKMDFNLICYQP